MQYSYVMVIRERIRVRVRLLTNEEAEFKITTIFG